MRQLLSSRKVLRRLAYPVTCDEGQALVEFALVAVIFLTLIFGVIDFGRLFESWVTVQHAAREGARYAVTGRSDCNGQATTREGCIIALAGNAAAGLQGAPAAVTVSITSYDYPAYTVSHAGTAGKACDEVEVKVAYDHHLMTPLVSAIISHVPVQGRERVLNEPFGLCGG